MKRILPLEKIVQLLERQFYLEHTIIEKIFNDAESLADATLVRYGVSSKNIDFVKKTHFFYTSQLLNNYYFILSKRAINRRKKGKNLTNMKTQVAYGDPETAAKLLMKNYVRINLPEFERMVDRYWRGDYSVYRAVCQKEYSPERAPVMQ
jgi:hypothetical protein